MYQFKKYNSKPFVFWDIKNKFIKKKSNKFISTKVDFSKSTAKQKIDKTFKNKTFEKVLNQNSTKNEKNKNFEKVDFEKSTTKPCFREIDDLMKKSKQFISFKNNSSFNNEKTIDELLDESLLLIICTELIYSSNRFNKEMYQKVFGKDWKNIQSLL